MKLFIIPLVAATLSIAGAAGASAQQGLATGTSALTYRTWQQPDAMPVVGELRNEVRVMPRARPHMTKTCMTDEGYGRRGSCNR